MARETTFNFIEEAKVKTKKEEPTHGLHALLTKQNCLYFNRYTVEQLGLSGALLKFYLDVDRRAIGFRVFYKGTLEDMDNLKRVTLNKGSAGIVSIGRLLKKMGVSGTEFPTTPVLKIGTYNGEYLTDKVYYLVVPKLKKDASDASEEA